MRIPYGPRRQRSLGSNLLTLYMVSLLSGIASTGRADEQSLIYQWIDEQGIAHYTDDLGLVPPEYRLKAEQQASQYTPQQGTFNVVPALPVTAQPNANVGEREDVWRKRINQLKLRLKSLEEQKSAVETKMRSARGKYYSVAAKQEYTDAKAENERLSNVIDLIRSELTAIPEEARRAGVPPGWVQDAITHRVKTSGEK